VETEDSPRTIGGGRELKIFFVTDIHGSEICWRKFLNAGPFYEADVVIVGGDITGKAMVPIVERGGRWETTLQDHLEVLDTEVVLQGRLPPPTAFHDGDHGLPRDVTADDEIGRASCRERV